MQFLYLSIIPTLIAILMLVFNKHLKERYKKRSVHILIILLISQVISIVHERLFIYHNHNNMISLKYLIALSCVYTLSPILVLCVNKVYKAVNK